MGAAADVEVSEADRDGNVLLERRAEEMMTTAAIWKLAPSEGSDMIPLVGRRTSIV